MPMILQFQGNKWGHVTRMYVSVSGVYDKSRWMRSVMIECIKQTLLFREVI